jgi:hypothetical protein
MFSRGDASPFRCTQDNLTLLMTPSQELFARRRYGYVYIFQLYPHWKGARYGSSRTGVVYVLEYMSGHSFSTCNHSSAVTILELLYCREYDAYTIFVSSTILKLSG